MNRGDDSGIVIDDPCDSGHAVGEGGGAETLSDVELSPYRLCCWRRGDGREAGGIQTGEECWAVEVELGQERERRQKN